METKRVPRGIPWESGLVVVANPTNKLNSTFIIGHPFGIPSCPAAIIGLGADAFKKEG